MTLFSIEDDLFQGRIDEPLEESKISNNATIVSVLFNYENVMSCVKQSLEKNGVIVPVITC